VSQAATITGLALRELWISFRLLGLLLVCVAAGASVALVPGTVAATLERLALGLAIAIGAAAGIAGWSLAAERTTGRAGWLVGRSVGRSTLLGGWFSAVVAVTVVGIAVAAGLGWVTIAGYASSPGPLALVALVASVVGWSLAAVALGLLLGSFLPRAVAGVVAGGAALAIGLVPWIAPAAADVAPYLPGAGLGLLAAASEADRLVGPALRAAGMSLGTAAVLLVASRAALERAEL
jgi:hypothetical protein